MRFVSCILFLFLFNLFLFGQKEPMEIVSIQALNSEYDDYAPLFLDSATIIFSSSRPNPLAERNLKGNHNIYISRKQGDNWSNPEMISYLSNSDNHESTAGISADRKTIFIYKTFNSGDIYSSDVRNNKLNPLKKAPFNSQWHESSACFANNTLYFVSNRPGGKGGHDLYYCVAEEKGWSDPINIEIVNTEHDENYISVTPNADTLYFSSKGHNSKGGYDVFYSVKQNGLWTKPTSLGDLINTVSNEICFTKDLSGNMYFASDKTENNSKGYNIYACFEKKVRMKVPLKMVGLSPLVETKTGTVDLIKNFIEVEGLRRFIPDKIDVNVSSVLDSNNVIHIGDLIINPRLTLHENKEEPVIRVKKQISKLENLSLEEVKQNINFEINYCAVQVGAFTWKTSITDFAKDYPLLADKVLMIQHPTYNRFVMRETFEDLDSAIALQKKCMIEYHSVPDTFVAVYDMNNKRVLIYFDYAKNSFKMLRPEDQFNDDVLRP